jgi:DNA processing protein
LLKQGAKLVATWEDVCEELPENVRLALTPAKPDESQGGETASLFPSDDPLGPHERKIFALLKADEATQIDEIVDRLEPEMSSSEILAALFELELAREGEAVAGEEFCEELLSFQLSAFSRQRSTRIQGGHAKTKSESVGEGVSPRRKSMD